jgi:RNA recognition motif-containing protein
MAPTSWLRSFIVNIYVGNLSYQVTDEELRAAFEVYGEVSSAAVIRDKFTGEAKGFGFVEMPKQAEAEAAIKKLNGKELKGRTLTVNLARPRKEDTRGGGGRRRF